MKKGRVLSVLESISKFDKKIKPESFLQNGFVKLNGKVIKTDIECNSGDTLHIKKEEFQINWDFFTIC